MIRNYLAVLEYDGTKYNGWQKQGNTPNTIQEKFENVLSRMTGSKTEIFASGRTDAGVHAEGQTANFKCSENFSEDFILNYLNQYLPEDIAVLSVQAVDERFHSRLNAVSKTYEYTIAPASKPNVFIRKYVYYTPKYPDIDKMKSCAELLLGTHDFKGFSSAGKTKKSTVRTINSIEIIEENNLIKIVINGSGFLYNMVRILCGTMLEIGLGTKNISVINQIFESKSRENAGITLPANGLKLKQVFY